MPPKQKAPDAGYQKLKTDLASGDLGRLYLFHGPEAYLRDYYLGQMREKLLPAGLETFNLHILQGKETDARKLRESVDALPMMAERTLVVANDYDIYGQPEAERTALAELLEDLPEYVCLVFVYDVIPYKPDARMKALAGAVKKYGTAVEFAPQGQSELVRWIIRRFRAQELEIDSADAQYMIFLCGDLMVELISEIGKVGAYAKGPRVTRGDIDAVAVPKLDAVIFQMTDAVARGEFDRAARVLGDLLRMQEAPIKLLSVLQTQLRQMHTARLALERGKNAAWLTELWGMRSPYQAQRLLESARGFSLGWCRNAVRRCAEADLYIKSTQGADGEQALTDLLLALAAEA